MLVKAGAASVLAPVEPFYSVLAPVEPFYSAVAPVEPFYSLRVWRSRRVCVCVLVCYACACMLRCTQTGEGGCFAAVSKHSLAPARPESCGGTSCAFACACGACFCARVHECYKAWREATHGARYRLRCMGMT